MQSAQKNCCYFFLQSAQAKNLPPFLFHLVMPRHVLGTCYAHFEHTRGYKGVCNILLDILCEVMSAKHAWASLEKNICIALFTRGWYYWTYFFVGDGAFISFDQFNIHPNSQPLRPMSPPICNP
jgi:hypothetical protein